MDELLAAAIANRITLPEADQPPIIYSPRGAIITRPPNELDLSDVQPILEAVALPILAGVPFVICQEAFLGGTAGVRPAEDPAATEALLFQHYTIGVLSSMWVVPISTDDRGEVSFGDPTEMTSPMLMGRSSVVGDWIRTIVRLESDPDADTPSLMSALTYIAAKGHVVAWSIEGEFQ